MMKQCSRVGRSVRIGLVAISFCVGPIVSTFAQPSTPVTIRHQSDPGQQDVRRAKPVPVLNERYAMIRTPQQRAEFDRWRVELRQRALDQSNPDAGARRIRDSSARPTATQKSGAVTIFTVNTDYDDPDDNPGDGACYDGVGNGSINECTLRAAIEETNATPGLDLVIIQIDMVSLARGAGQTVAHNTTDDLWTLFVNTPASIDTFSVLPPITRDNVLIDATMQLDGSGSGTFDDAYCGNPVVGDTSIVKVALDGSMLTGGDAVGLEIQANNVEIRGLAVKNFPSVGIFASGSDNFKVTCTYLGTDHFARNAEANGTSGLAEQTASNFRFTRGIASGNSVAGLIAGSRGGVIDSSFFGIDVTGLSALSLSETNGLWVDADSVTVKNVFAGGVESGLYISGDSAIVHSSFFGVGADSTTAVPNDFGIHVAGNGSHIGGPVGMRVLASGNVTAGIWLESGTDENVVHGAIAGADLTGTFAIPNEVGILDDGIGNIIGELLGPPAPGGPVLAKGLSSATVPGGGSWANLISGNTDSGIKANGTSVIVRNFIGTNSAGNAALANDMYGIWLNDGVNHQVGGNFSNGNLISGNGDTGLLVYDDVSKAEILGNYIGTNFSGTAAVGNGSNGGIIVFGDQVEIGSSNTGERNVISGNGGSGISVANTASSTQILGNFIGTNHLGTTAIGNGGYGILNMGSATDIGGDVPGEGNLISGNGSSGVYDEGTATVYNGNYIGTNAAGLAAIANNGLGIQRIGTQTVIGGTTESTRNVISGNVGAGIRINSIPPPSADPKGGAVVLRKSEGITNHTIFGNLIGTAVDTVTSIGNTGPGIWIDNGGVTIIGGSEEQANIIGYNSGPGVRVDDEGTTTITHNLIFGNTGLGIDLGGDGVTPNDGGTPPDTDIGPNDLQNFPVIDHASDYDASQVEVSVDLASAPATVFRLDFYFNKSADPTGYGEGQRWIGRVTDATDVDGLLTVTELFLKDDLPLGSWVTVTATEPFGKTSEFSLALQVGGEGVALSSAKVFLEGPYGGGSMSTALNGAALIPLAQPYGDALFNGKPHEFDDVVSVTSVPTGVVDWVVLSLRSTTDPGSETTRVVAFVKSDGTLVDTDDNSDVAFAGVTPGSFYLVVCHRNHVCAMSSSALDFSGGSSTWDFTTGQSQAYSGGGDGMKHLGSGVYGLFAGDSNADGLLTAPDFNDWNAATTAGTTGYFGADFNMEGNATAADFNFWNANTTAGAASQVPN